MDRIVTGVGQDGRATIVRSDTLLPVAGLPGSRTETRLAWAAAKSLALTDADETLSFSPTTSAFPSAGETRFVMVTFPPDFATPIHATPTTDYVVVVAGELWLVMDDGSERKLSPGDSVIQRGTSHAWQNRSGTPCTIAATMIGLMDA